MTQHHLLLALSLFSLISATLSAHLCLKLLLLPHLSHFAGFLLGTLDLSLVLNLHDPCLLPSLVESLGLSELVLAVKLSLSLSIDPLLLHRISALFGLLLSLKLLSFHLFLFLLVLNHLFGDFSVSGIGFNGLFFVFSLGAFFGSVDLGLNSLLFSLTFQIFSHTVRRSLLIGFSLNLMDLVHALDNGIDYKLG